MVVIRWLLNIFIPLTKRIGLCGNTGLITGGVVGFLLSVVIWVFPFIPPMSYEAALLSSFVLSLFAWLVVLFILCVQASYTFKSVALPSFFNSQLTGLLTVLISRWLNSFSYSWLLGMCVGIIVGLVLCRINAAFRKDK